MASVAIRIPQMGEGLHEARLVATLKNPGDPVKRDEPIYQMETDKAVMDIESPHDGVLLEWLAKADDILPIGAEIARMETEQPVGSPVPTTPPLRGPSIPPRTRAYAREKGVSDDQMARLAGNSSKLMPADIDAFLAMAGDRPFDERPVPPKQRVLNSRLVRATQLVVPGTITVAVNWESVDRCREAAKAAGGEFQPSAFTMLAYAVAQTVRDHPSLRTSILGEETFRTYRSLSLGIAVSLPGDELLLAVVEDADSLGWLEFASRTRQRIELARSGRDQAVESVTLSLTNMQGFGLRDAVPVVVPPACATLFIGELYPAVVEGPNGLRTRKTCNLTLTFDHRVMNGVGAAQFMNGLKAKVESIAQIIE
jgi:pyruvate dehydrogenase E2 component (dihydrolipoamide acetyltransferase)